MLTIIHVSAADNVGGSGRSAYRIHSGLRAQGHRSRMLVNYRSTTDPDVGYLWRSLSWRVGDYLVRRATEALSLQYLFYPSSFALARHPWFREADIVQLYNTHGGYFSHSALAVLSRRKPIVWRLSDMWPMTGHCAYSYDCDRWKTGCGACPILDDEPALRTNRTALLWKMKRAVYARSRLTIVAPSRWMAATAAASPLLGRFPIHVIPNGVDTNVFAPIPRPSARDLFGIPHGDRVVLFAAVETNARRKGGHHLQAALERLGDVRLRLLVVGSGAERWTGRTGHPVTAVSAVADDRLLAAAYSAADVFVMPTLAENLPNVALESMACGTPSIAFDVGGVPDAVRPAETGWLVPTADDGALAEALRTALTDDATRERFGRRCRAVAASEYTAELQTTRFARLYEEVLCERHGGARAPAAAEGVA